MTDDRRYYLLGRMSFPDHAPTMVGHDPQKLLPSPQYFGREPETFGQGFVLGLGHALGLTYDEITGDYPADEPPHAPTRWKRAVVTGHDALAIQRAIKAVSGMSNVIAIDIDMDSCGGVLVSPIFESSAPRWIAPCADPLGDISLWPDEVFGYFDTPLVEPLAKPSNKPYLEHDPTKQHRRRRRK